MNQKSSTGKNRKKQKHLQSPDNTARELNDIKRALRSFKASLRKRYPKRGPGSDQREAIDIIQVHLKNHGKNLWGHIIPIPKKYGGGVKIIPRTTNNLERSHGVLKSGERRRSGRKNLSKDFEDLHPAAPLIQNLNKPDYVKCVPGSIEKLPELFAEIDRKKRMSQKNKDSTPTPRKTFCTKLPETASLSKRDRNFIRKINIGSKIELAAASRAPKIDVSRGQTV